MNCRQCREQFIALLEGLLESSVARRVESHLADCSGCRADFEEARELAGRLTREGRNSPDASLEVLVIDRILQQQAAELRRLKMQRQVRWMQTSGAVAAAVVLITVLGIWSARPDEALSAAQDRLDAAQAMAQGAEAVPEITSIHILAKMRTSPSDNLSHVDPEMGFVPVEFWIDYGNAGKWRMEKPGRVIAMDGKSTAMLVRPNQAVVLSKPTIGSFDTDWLHRIAAVRSYITDDLRSALAAQGELRLVPQENDEDSDTVTVVVDIRSKLKEGDYVKNKFITLSDNRRAYHFDRKSGRLKGLEIYLQQGDEDTLVFEVTKIVYNEPIDPQIFALDLPDDTVMFEEPRVLPNNEKYARMTPQEAARAFFEACAQEDWEEYMKFSVMRPTDRVKRYIGGLAIVKIGEPFESEAYPGWYVPYEIKLKSGKVKKYNLALRKDNSAKRFVVDGGI